MQVQSRLLLLKPKIFLEVELLISLRVALVNDTLDTSGQKSQKNVKKADQKKRITRPFAIGMAKNSTNANKN